jgi:magnesium and cobalt transporter
VIGENKDDVVGILLAKELLNYYANPESFDLQDTLRPAVFVPESKRLNVLLRDFPREPQSHGDRGRRVRRRVGLVTIEDVLEQIVGDIEDEYDFDESEDNIIAEPNGRYRVKARPRSPISTSTSHGLLRRRIRHRRRLVLQAFGGCPSAARDRPSAISAFA